MLAIEPKCQNMALLSSLCSATHGWATISSTPRVSFRQCNTACGLSIDTARERFGCSSLLCRRYTALVFYRNRRCIDANRAATCIASLKALIFDCDGVIVESEDLHRRAYNSTFSHFNVRCPGSAEPVNWSSEFYDQLQNQIGGGKPKMRWYFNTNGWPSSTIFSAPPVMDADNARLIDTLQDWKTQKYKEIISSGDVKPRPGVLQLMDAARSNDIKLAVCSASTKSSVIFCLTNLLGKERFEELDCFLAGDDVEEKKPHPSIYKVASKRLGVPPEQCMVVEDSLIGLQAALGAGMSCIISYTSSTCNQDFSRAQAVYPDLGTVCFQDLVELQEAVAVLSNPL
eukprot:c28207_g1_i1 orf=280-1308(+)